MRIVFVLLLLQLAYSQIFNSGCFMHDKGASDFCEKIGCTKQSGSSKSYEPSIMFYLDKNGKININFLCKQNIVKNKKYGSKYEIAYSNIENEFFVPYTKDETQYWYGPSFVVNNNTIELLFSNLHGFNNDDTIELVNENEIVYCGFKIGDLIDNHVYKIQTNMFSYKVKVSINSNENQNLIFCNNFNISVTNKLDNIHNFTVLDNNLRRNVNKKFINIAETADQNTLIIKDRRYSTLV